MILRWLLTLLLVGNCSALLCNEPYTYLKDERLFAFNGNEFELISVDISRDMRIEILTEAGTQHFQTFTLPETIDPLQVVRSTIAPELFISIDKVIEIDILVRRQGNVLRPEQSKPDYRKVDVLPSGSHFYVKAIFYDYELPALQVGDVIDIRYTYRAPINGWKNSVSSFNGMDVDTIQTIKPHINDNALGSFRIFFHDVISKQSSKVRIESPLASPLRFFYPNQGEPHRSQTLDKVVDKWEFDFLPGALSEVGARPYESLPHIEVVQPNRYARYPELMRQVNFTNDYVSVRVGSTFQPFSGIGDFVEAVNKETSDTSALQKFKHLHHTIALSFAYDDDDELYRSAASAPPRMDISLEKRTLHEINKYQLYRNLIQLSGLDYAYGFIADKRYGSISSHFYHPKFRDDYFFLPIDEVGNLIFIQPKSTAHGWLADELPFYYEVARIQTVHTRYSLTKQSGSMWEGSKTLSYFETPRSERTYNQRQLSGKWTLSEVGHHCAFALSLTGQYSTLTRNLYLYNEPHPYIAEHYHEKWWHSLPVEDLQANATLVQTQFPFQSKVTGSFRLSADDSLPIGTMLQHPIMHIDTPRVLAYYPDFVGDERTSFLIDLGNYKVESLPEAIDVRNDFASYTFRIEQVDERTLRLTSWLSITSTKINPEHIAQVTEIYSAVELAQQYRLSLSVR